MVLETDGRPQRETVVYRTPANCSLNERSQASFDDLQLAILKLKGLALEHRMADVHARTIEYSSHNSGFLKSGAVYSLVPARAHHEVPS